ncbi:MAG: tetratricopeptide repeat protein [Anaerolineae bacterium]|jgi:tetratricopeptide (TPR) repeat protein
MSERRFLSTLTIRRAIWITLATLLVVLVAFAGYYVWDRYIYLGNHSPVELQIASIEEAVHNNPQDAEARIVLARSYLISGQDAQALSQAEQVLNLYPDNTDALLLAGMAHVRLDQPEAALPPLERFVARRRGQPMAGVDNLLETAYYYLGESYLVLERPGEAIPVLEAALSINPVDADALYQLGLAYQANDQPKLALEPYHRAVQLVPDFAEAYHNMGQCYAALEQPDYEAYARGMEAFSHQDYAQAVLQLEKATDALPDFAPAFLGIGLAYEKMGRPEVALQAMERALELDPGDLAAQHALGRVRAALGSGD